MLIIAKFGPSLFPTMDAIASVHKVEKVHRLLRIVDKISPIPPGRTPVMPATDRGYLLHGVIVEFLEIDTTEFDCLEDSSWGPGAPPGDRLTVNIAQLFAPLVP